MVIIAKLPQDKDGLESRQRYILIGHNPGGREIRKSFETFLSAIERALFAREYEEFLPGQVFKANGTLVVDRVGLDIAMAKMVGDSNV